jgi:hypothetical protein
MRAILLIPLAAQLGVPLLLLAWVASGRCASRLAWALAVLLTAAWVVGIAAAGLWLVLPWYLPLVYSGMLVLAVLHTRAAAARPAWPSGNRALAGTVVVGLAAAVVGVIALSALAGRRMPDQPVELAPPLRHGTYLVVNGGNTNLINSHMLTLEESPRFRPWRGQSYGVDLVRLGRGGLRARGVSPRDPAAYGIFGDTIIAPCRGRVVSIVDGLADLPVPETDRAHMAGNNVVLECDGVWVLLAHMRRGSVLVRAGEQVETGRPVGQVGNTGNTGEPHLHVHAQRPGTPTMPLGGEPLPLTIAGRYLVRGQRVTW